MLRPRSLAPLTLLALGCHGPINPVRTPVYSFVDLTGHFADCYDRTHTLSTDQRVPAFTACIGPLLPDFYNPSRFGAAPNGYPDAVARALDSFPAIRTPFQHIATVFRAGLPEALRVFTDSFADLPPLGTIYLLHSLGELNGGTRTIGSELQLVFGADVLARQSSIADERSLLHYELFHFYHHPYFTACAGMWCNLWREGLAVYAASRLNPQASDEELGLTRPQPLRAFVDTHLPAVVCAIRVRLDSTNNAPYFSSGRTLGDFPPRFGYYVGYLVAQQAGRHHSMASLAHLTPTEARPIVETALSALASCTSR